jgi:PAS domain S-box-containing protein
MITPDITGSKHVGITPHEIAALSQQVTKHIRDVFWLVSADWQEVLYVSPAYEEIWGRSCESLYARPVDWLDSVVDADREQLISAISRESAGDRADVTFSDFRIHRPDGSERWIHARAFPVCDAEGNVYRFAGIAEDITEHKLARIALEERDRSFKEAQAIAHIGSWHAGLTGSFTWSDELYRIYGVSPETFTPNVETLINLIHPDDQPAMQAWINACASGDEPEALEFRCVWPDGTIRYISGQGKLMLDADGKPSHMAGTGQDITARKCVEEALRASEERLQLAITVGNIGVWDWNVVENELTWDESTYLLYGVRKEDFSGAYDAWSRALHPDDRQLAEVEIQAALRGEREFSHEFRIVRLDGTVRNIKAVSKTFRDQHGNTLRMIGINIDITEYKQAEQALLQAGQHKDEFLAMLAHELRNPLAPIRNAAYVLAQLGLDEPRVKWAQETIEGQVTHLVRLVDDLLDAARLGRGKITLKQEEIELTALVEKLMQSIQPLAENKGHQLIVRLPEHPVRLRGDPVRLNQILLNLFDNAIKYTPDGGWIELAARMAGQEIEISVRDNGMGISAKLLPRVFDLFQQDERKLDRAQGGLGIGLTLVQRLAAMHGGRVKADSEGPWLGATFTVWLPAKAMPARPAAPEAEDNVSLTSGMRVLVVDDDVAVADSMAMLLEVTGYEVRIADSGQAALEQVPLFRPQVVLLDIGLTGMDGFETAKRLRELSEGLDLYVVALTGYADEETREKALASGCDYFLVKPVTITVLASLLEKVAETARSPTGAGA